jgi:hypothetical protein
MRFLFVSRVDLRHFRVLENAPHSNDRAAHCYASPDPNINFNAVEQGRSQTANLKPVRGLRPNFQTLLLRSTLVVLVF